MLDREMSLLDIVARHPLFSWLRGKRTRASDADSSSSIQNFRGGGITSKRRNSPPPVDPPGAGGADGKEWDRVLPAPVSKLVITAPVSTCSGSTLSRTASWSEATVGSECDMRTFGRLQQHSSEGAAAQDQFPEKSPLRVAQGTFQGVGTGVCYTAAAIPINIPCRVEKNEPNIVLQEAARQSLGEMELRMSLPSARASRRGIKPLSGEASHARTFQRSTAVARNVHVASRPQGLVVRGEEEEELGREAVRSSGSGLAATPSSFWRGTPSMRPLDGPSPSNSCGEFEGCCYVEATPRAASNRGSSLGALEFVGGGDRREDKEEGTDEDGEEEEDEDEEDSSNDSDLIFDLEP